MVFGDGTFSMGRYFPQGSFKKSMWDLVAVLEQKVVDQMDTSLSSAFSLAHFIFAVYCLVTEKRMQA